MSEFPLLDKMLAYHFAALTDGKAHTLDDAEGAAAMFQLHNLLYGKIQPPQFDEPVKLERMRSKAVFLRQHAEAAEEANDVHGDGLTAKVAALELEIEGLKARGSIVEQDRIELKKRAKDAEAGRESQASQTSIWRDQAEQRGKEAIEQRRRAEKAETDRDDADEQRRSNWGKAQGAIKEAQRQKERAENAEQNNENLRMKIFAMEAAKTIREIGNKAVGAQVPSTDPKSADRPRGEAAPAPASATELQAPSAFSIVGPFGWGVWDCKADCLLIQSPTIRAAEEWIRRENDPDVYALVAIVKVLDVSARTLLFDSGPSEMMKGMILAKQEDCARLVEKKRDEHRQEGHSLVDYALTEVALAIRDMKYF